MTNFTFEREIINTSDDLLRCNGMLLEDIFDLVKDEIEKCQKNGIRYKVYCKIDDSWNYKNTECFVDDVDIAHVFNDNSFSYETINQFLLANWETVYKMSYMKQQPRGWTKIDIYREDYIDRHFKFEFNIPMSYAWYRKHCCGDSGYEHCFDIVQKYITSWDGTEHFLNVTFPYKYFKGTIR